MNIKMNCVFCLQVIENQKLGLLEALLGLGDWSHARLLMERFPPHWASRQPNITRALAALAHHMLEPFYNKYAKTFKFSILQKNTTLKLKSLFCEIVLILYIKSLRNHEATQKFISLLEIALFLGKIIFRRNNPMFFLYSHVLYVISQIMPNH